MLGSSLESPAEKHAFVRSLIVSLEKSTSVFLYSPSFKNIYGMRSFLPYLFSDLQYHFLDPQRAKGLPPEEETHQNIPVSTMTNSWLSIAVAT